MRIIYLIFLGLLTTSCNTKLKETIGLQTKGPDEYKVQSSKPLEVPPHYNLPEPHKKASADQKQVATEDLSQAQTDQKTIIQDLLP